MSWSQCFRFSSTSRDLAQVVLAARLGHGDAASFEAAHPAFDERFEHRDAGEMLVLSGDQVPMGVVLVGGVKDVDERLEVRRSLLAIAPGLGRQFPLLHRILLAVLEPVSYTH